MKWWIRRNMHLLFNRKSCIKLVRLDRSIKAGQLFINQNDCFMLYLGRGWFLKQKL